MPEEAFHHAVAGDDLDLVVHIFDRYINLKLMCGEFRDVQRWLDALPASWYSAYPALGLARAGLLAYAGAFDACVRCVDDVERRLTHTGDYQGIPPTGKQGTVTGITINRVANGKVAEGWTNFDALGMLQQLGVLPTPGRAS